MTANEAAENGVPGNDISVRHIFEHLEGTVNGTGFRVEAHEGIGDGDEGVEAGGDGKGVDLCARDGFGGRLQGPSDDAGVEAFGGPKSGLNGEERMSDCGRARRRSWKED